MARTTKLTPELAGEIAGYVGEGLSYKDSCKLAGIGTSTFHRWRERGENSRSGVYRELWEGLKGAEASFKQANIAIIRRAATEPTETTVKEIRKKMGIDKNGKPIVLEEVQHVREEKKPPTWQPAAWLLERRYPEEFGRRLEHSGKMDIAGMPPPVLQLVFDDGEGDSELQEAKQPQQTEDIER